jgi:hypothetical protein
MGTQVLSSIQNYVMNVNIMNAQFDVDALYDEAKKLGLDAGDLSEYGFDVKSSACGGNTCLRKENFKDYDDFLNKGNNFTGKIAQKGSALYKKASCHPLMKKYVNPRVEYIWNMFPLNILFPLPAAILNICTIPWCWFLFIPFQCFITGPWNTFMGFAIGAPLTVVLLVMLSPIVLIVAFLSIFTGTAL